MLYSKRYLRLLAIDSRKRYLYTLALSAVIFCAWLFLCYLPVERKLSQLDREIKQLKKDSDSDTEQQAACKKLSDRFTQLQQDLYTAADGVLSDSNFITQLTDYTEDAHMQLASLRVSNRSDRGWYSSVRLTFEAIGTLQAIAQFFTRLSENHIFVQSDDLSLHRQAGDSFLLHCVLRRAVLDVAHIVEVKSPSTLKKAEGLGG